MPPRGAARTRGTVTRGARLPASRPRHPLGLTWPRGHPGKAAQGAWGSSRVHTGVSLAPFPQRPPTSHPEAGQRGPGPLTPAETPRFSHPSRFTRRRPLPCQSKLRAGTSDLGWACGKVPRTLSICLHCKDSKGTQTLWVESGLSPCWLTSGKLLGLSEPHFPHLCLAHSRPHKTQALLDCVWSSE